VVLLAATLFSQTMMAAGGVNVLLKKTYSGNIDYVAVGASFRDTPNSIDSCSFISPMSSTVTLNIPVGATILDAFLYYAGSADIGPNYHTSEIDLSDQTALTLNGVSIPTSAGFNGVDFPNLTAIGGGVVDFFGARRDVSSIVTGAGAYTLAGMVVHTEAQNRPTTGTCLGAWAIVVVYEDISITNIRVVNLFDGFQAFKNETFDLDPRNFVVDSGTPNGKMTHLTYEGDEQLVSAGETFELQVGTGGFALKTNALNPTNNQYNSTVTGPDVFDTNSTWGFDLDTYDITSDLAGQTNAFIATTRYNSGNDLVVLMAEFISVDNKALADIEVTLNDIGLFQSNTTNSAQYLISIQNNGDGANIISTGFATGFIHITNDLPAGISIDNMSDITAPGWDCSATVVANDEIRCVYDLSTLAGGQLDRNDSLPDITITVDVATPVSPVTSIVRATLCDVDPDTCTTFVGKHDNAAQFDPVNDFESFEDLFDVDAKSDTNNNVDAEVTAIITGAPSDLTTSSKSVVDLNGGTLDPNDILEYTITLTETANVSATGVTIDTNTNSFNYQSSSCAGATDSFSGGILTVSNITVPANGSCNVIFRVTVQSTSTAGTAIDNSAVIANGNGTGATATAPTLLVAGIATGSKILYLDNLSSSRDLTRDAPSLDTTTTITTSSSITFNLSPTLAAALDINSGIIPVSIWIEAVSAGDYDITAELRYDSGGANTLIGTASLNNITMATGVGNAQLFPLQITLASDITDLDLGEDIALTITNGGGSAGSVIAHSILNSIDSNIVVDAANVINVDSITFYDDLARTNVVVTVDAGTTIYIEAVISDPFGAFDITNSRLTLIDPNLANQLSNVSMTEDVGAITLGTKTYAYTYNVPPATSVSPGIWVAQITADEGQEGTITHTEADSFTTTAPTVEVSYTVSPITSTAGGLLTYTIVITNAGGAPATGLFINQTVPTGTSNITVINNGGGTDVSAGTTINISSITVPAAGSTTIVYTVDINGGAVSGDLIDHIILVDNMGIIVQDIAASVLIDPFDAPAGNKLLYADNLSSSKILDRTIPVSDTTLSIPSQGANDTISLSPVLQSDLNLATGDIELSIWMSRGASFAGERTIEATLAYTGASTGTIGSDTVTITLQDGLPGAQYVPFVINLASPLTILANSSLTLTITNNTSISGETVTIHSFRDTTNPSRIALNAISPLTIVAIEVLNNDIDLGGTVIPTAGPGDTIWVRATVEDPFGSADISSATLTITDPLSVITLSASAMSEPVTQPVSGAQKYFQLSHVLSTELGDWDLSVTAAEGSEGTVSATNNVAFNVNDDNPDLTDSYKAVANISSGDLSNTNGGDTLRYTIELVEIGGAAATSVDVTDVIPTNTTFVSGTLTVDGVVQADPAGNISLIGLTVPALGTMTIEFDVLIDTPLSAGTIISNTADVTNPNGVVTNITLNSQDVVLAGPPASGTKALYLEDLDTTAIITRAQPQTAGTGDSIVLQNAGGSVTMDLTPVLAGEITLDPIDGDIPVILRMNRVGANNRNRFVEVTLGYHSGGAVTSIGTVSQFAFLTTAITSYTFNIPLAAITVIPAGNQLRLTVTNNQAQNQRDLELYSFDSAGNFSTVNIVPTPVINVDSITFWTDTMGAGTQVTNPDPNGVDVDIYARIIISDPFGDADIQAPDDPTNPTTVVITDPDANAVLDGSTSCTAPCYAYDGEDTINDPANDGTRTFYYIVRIDSDPPATRGTWTVQVTANEGLETGVISHVAADSFTTLSQANLSTSIKEATGVVGDVDPSDTLTYVITITNTGGQAADNVVFSDTLQTSPVTLTFSSASTTCTDETASALPNPSHSAGVVSLNNISVNVGASCTITINTTVGAGTPGDLIDNSATIINPMGPGSTPQAETIVLSASQVPVAGAKQLYVDGLDGASILTRTQPTSISSINLSGNDGRTETLNYNLTTTREVTLASGQIDVKLYLAEAGPGRNRQTFVELFVDANDGGGLQSIDSTQQNINLNGTASLRTLSLTNASPLVLNPGSTFQLVITNNTTQNDRILVVSQVTSAPYSEIVMPVTGSIEVTELIFFDRSGTNEAGDPGCSPTCGSQIDPGIVESGFTIWTRATIADAFGSFDVNTGCDGVTTTNCPTIVVTDPTPADQTPVSPADELTFLEAPDTSSRRYEFEVNPAGFGLEGIWQIEVFGSEGVEDAISDSALTTFERYGPPVLTVVKTVSGTTSPGQVVTYNNDVNNTGTGAALTVVLSNEIGSFLSLELTESGGNWTAVLSLSGIYTVNTEEFDSGNGLFDYDPNLGVCGVPTVGPPCYDPAILEWRIELNETLPVSGNLVQEYRVMIQ